MTTFEAEAETAQTEVTRLAAVYGITTDDENGLFLFLMGLGGCRKLIVKYPALFQTEWPETWDRYQQSELNDS